MSSYHTPETPTATRRRSSTVLPSSDVFGRVGKMDTRESGTPPKEVLLKKQLAKALKEKEELQNKLLKVKDSEANLDSQLHRERMEHKETANKLAVLNVSSTQFVMTVADLLPSTEKTQGEERKEEGQDVEVGPAFGEVCETLLRDANFLKEWLHEQAVDEAEKQELKNLKIMEDNLYDFRGFFDWGNVTFVLLFAMLQNVARTTTRKSQSHRTRYCIVP